MKKIILFVVLLVVSCLGGFSQVLNTAVAFTGLSTTNVQTAYLVIPSAKALTGNYTIALTVVPVNTSGTATVTAVPQASFDGTVWVSLNTTAVTVNNAGTVIPYGFNYDTAAYKYYRVALSSTGTGVTAFTGAFIIKKTV